MFPELISMAIILPKQKIKTFQNIQNLVYILALKYQ